MTQDWRGPVNALLYGIIFAPEITDEVVAACAEAAVNYTVLGDGPEVYYEAIQKALTSGERLDNLGQLPQFDQAQIAGYLRAVATQLDALRPWPEPKFRRLSAATWTTFANAVPIARLDASILRVRSIVRGVFEPAGDAQPGRYVLMLKLATGETVALLGSHGPQEKVTLFTDAADNPAEVIEHFRTATGFPPDKITPI
ncbi:MAG TPA: hypothetical protein VKA77_07390 [Mycobacterium sp.]|nr:hypothetical protein [Mycobacterium sp.]